MRIGYDEHDKDYSNYSNAAPTQATGKAGGNANIANLNDLNVNYAKQLDKQQSNPTGGYHTPPPTQSAYSQNPLAGAQQAYPFIPQQIISQHQPSGAPLIMPSNMQDNSRGGAGLANTNKQQQQQQQQSNKSAYQANSWS